MHAKNYLRIKETISHKDPPFQDKIILNAHNQITHSLNRHTRQILKQSVIIKTLAKEQVKGQRDTSQD